MSDSSRRRRLDGPKLIELIESVEPLEGRLLLSSVVLKDKHLTVRGDLAAPNDIVVRLDPTRKLVQVVLNGSTYAYKKGQVTRVVLVGGNADDTLRVDATAGKLGIPVTFVDGNGNDLLVGGNESDRMFAGNGNDTIVSGNGDDSIVAGSGNDQIAAGNAFKLIYAGNGNDTVTAGNGDGYIFGEGGDDLIQAGGNFEICGQGGNDTLSGHGRDTLWGGGGNDVLRGGDERHPGELPGIAKIQAILRPSPPAIPDLPGMAP
jgi:Ca2+-binding RTX toxin-like protein